MRNSSLRWKRAALGLFVMIGANSSRAQVADEPSTAAVSGQPSPLAGAGFGPLLNPAVNPYLNPYLSNTQIPTDVAVMSILQANKASGGIGSGALSGVRDLEAGRRRSTSKPQQNAVAPVPSASERAGRYFHRGQGRFGARAGSYFQRTGDRFDQ